MSGNARLTKERQETFVTALLQHGTIKRAAEICGIDYTTGRRWMALPEVQAALEAARREAAEAAIRKLQLALGEAVETLLSLLGPDNPATIRVRAATALLQGSLATGDILSIHERLAALEARQQQPARPYAFLPDLETKEADD